MNVERDIAGFALPFAAGVLITAYAGANFCEQSSSIHMLSLLTVFCSVTALLDCKNLKLSNLIQWPLIGIAAMACGVLSAATAISLIEMPESSLEAFCRGIGLQMQTCIDSIPFEDQDCSALIKALLTGERSGLSNEIKTAFRDSGASHILALSGLHLGIIYGILSKTISLLGNSQRMRAVRSILIICICGIYTMATGTGDSLMRAYIFIILREVAKMTSRYHGLGQILLASLIIQLVIDPLAIRSVSFQLSYAAMAGIAFVYPWLQGFWERAAGLLKSTEPEEERGSQAGWLVRVVGGLANKPTRWVWNTVALSIACQITTAPLAYMYFGTFPLYFMLTNLLTLPLTGLLIPAALLTVILSTLGCCPEILVQATEALVTLLIWLLQIISTM